MALNEKPVQTLKGGLEYVRDNDVCSCCALQYLDRMALEDSVPQQVFSSEGKAVLTAKLLLLDHMTRLENEVIEPKRKRSFPGSNTPLDRLSISTMDPKGSKQRYRH